MRCADRAACLALVVLLPLSGAPRTTPREPVYQRRYAMGTMFDAVAYDADPARATRALTAALDEVVRLDSVMSHFKADSDVARLNRARGSFVTVDPSLYDAIRESLVVSQRSGGRFDVTVAPLLRTWKSASARGTRPSDDEIARARRCVGHETIQLQRPRRIRLRSPCAEIDLGGIGKGFAVDRALRILAAAGIRNALINAGGSSISATGAQPGRDGWPVLIGRSVLMLRGRSLSTSQQDPSNPYGGDIIDPDRGAPAASRMLVGVVASSATIADALSTTLVMLSVPEGERLLAKFPGVSAVWTSPHGTVHAAFGELRLEMPRPN